MRKTIFEQIKDYMSYSTELKRLNTLINDNAGIYIDEIKEFRGRKIVHHMSIEDFVDQFAFKNWKARGTCISCKDMKDTLGLYTVLESDSPSFEETISFCEYVANLLRLINHAVMNEGYNYRTSLLVSTTETNLDTLMDWLNLESTYVEETEQTLIIQKQASVTAVAEIVDSSTSYRIVKYNHHTLKGNLTKKKEILLFLADKLEAKRKDLHETNSSLEDKIFFVLNNLSVRHNNSDQCDAYYKEYTAQMDSTQLEYWYDELYQMVLLAFLELEQNDRNKNIKDLKSHY